MRRLVPSRPLESHSSAEAAEEPKSTRTRTLGVLFVHGIGEQRQGDTLVRYGDSLACWLTRWLSKGTEVDPGSAAAVSVLEADLEPGGSSSAQATITIGDPVDRRWLLAESWWAETFRAPKTRPLLMWLLTILPYMLLEQFFAPLSRAAYLRTHPNAKRHGRSGRLWTVARYVTSALLLFAALPLAGVGIVLVALLLVPMLVPIERVRNLAKTAALKLANTLGDSFVLTSSPLQFDAMTARVARDLEALAGQVDEVAVVAHSQGTAVAYEAIKNYERPDQLRLFVTVGQALEKLAGVRELRKEPRRFRYVCAWLGVVCFYLLVAFTTRGIVLLATSGSAHNDELLADYALASVGLLGFAFMLSHLIGILKAARNWSPEAIELPLSDPVVDARPPLEWINYYASADPVSNGPLFEQERPLWMTEVEVWNHASILSDHTSYAACPDGFLGLLAIDLLRQQEVDPELTADWSTRVRDALRRRWWRVWWLSASRVLAAVGAVAGAISIWSRGHLEDVGGVLSFVKGGVHYVSLPVRNALGLSRDVIGDTTLTGIILVALVVAAGYLLLVALWKQWEAVDLRGFFSRGDRPPAPLGGVPFGLFVTSLALVTTLAVFVIVLGTYPTTGHDLVSVWLWALLSVPVAGAVVAWVLRRATRERVPEAPAAVPT
jgi:hypothetical protein